METHRDSFLRLCGYYLLIAPLLTAIPNSMSYNLMVTNEGPVPNRLEVVLAIYVLIALMIPILCRKHIADGFNRRGAVYTLAFAAMVFAFLGLTVFSKSYYELFPTTAYCKTFPPEIGCEAQSQIFLNLLLINMGFLSLGLGLLSIGYLLQRPKEKRKNDTKEKP